MSVSRTKLRLLYLISILTFAPHSVASDSTVSVGAGVSDSALTAGAGLQVNAPGSDLGLAISARLGSTYDGGLHGAVSGELRYAFDVFTYVPWAGVGLGLRLDDKVVVFPQATLGLSMMQGFDDALGIFVTKPLLFSDLSGPFPLEIGLYWSRRF